ncbi:MAG: TIGR03435 family protein [Bryobacteraceae bacterium]
MILLLILTLAALASAQDGSTRGQLKAAFEVISIKPMPSGRHDQFESYCADGGRFILRGTPLLWSIKWAYGLNDYQVSSGWPGWLNSFGTYEIEAETEGRVSEDQCRTMVQTLFEDRFKLRMPRQVKTYSSYAMVIGKNGSKLLADGKVRINGAAKQAASEREPPEGWTMARLANYLANISAIGRPVIDRTGLRGVYGVNLSYSTADQDGRPDIFTALQEQLGLKLQPVRAPIETFVIDHAERPGSN